ncbi:hypothetical protein [Actinoplanes ianthinogenes]|uniref:hypothetical protein n=1 Tax=Actinoplanes ianthinogenes TaxID=122358 RepID=UPI001E5E36E5|nr:hypothetical protein [Actinoplanes ianthinogenes]
MEFCSGSAGSPSGPSEYAITCRPAGGFAAAGGVSATLGAAAGADEGATHWPAAGSGSRSWASPTAAPAATTTAAAVAIRYTRVRGLDIGTA